MGERIELVGLAKAARFFHRPEIADVGTTDDRMAVYEEIMIRQDGGIDLTSSGGPLIPEGMTPDEASRIMAGFRGRKVRVTIEAID
jgi:hypothetical protein